MGIDESFDVFPDEQVIEELILLHEGLNNPRAILSIDFIPEVDEIYDRPSLIKVHDYSYKNVLRYIRPGLEDPKVGVEVEPEVWAIDQKLWRMIFLGVEPREEKRITSRMKRFPIRKQHHYQIVVVGQILGTARPSTWPVRPSTWPARPSTWPAHSSICAPQVEVQLVCWGDTFFGALDAKEFGLGSDMTRIVWDFYNKFETKIDIGFRVTDNRPAAEKEKVNVEETYIIKRAYLSCLGELD